MLPEVGMSELVVIAIVALIVVGPKDLPVLLRRFGQFMAKLRGMASEFRSSFDEMARQTELDELRKEVDAMRRGQFADIAELHPPMSYQYDTPDAPPLEISEVPKPARKPRKKTVVAAEATVVEAAPSRRKRAAKTVEAGS